MDAREEYIHRHIGEIARSEFPDNEHNNWRVLGMRHEDHTSVVEVEPEPDDVGYPRFKLVLLFRADHGAACIATYAWTGGGFELLCSEPRWSDLLPAAV